MNGILPKHRGAGVRVTEIRWGGGIASFLWSGMFAHMYAGFWICSTMLCYAKADWYGYGSDTRVALTIIDFATCVCPFNIVAVIQENQYSSLERN